MLPCVIVTILSCILFSAGTAMQKYGISTSFPKITLRELGKRGGEILSALGKNWLWVVGVIFWLFGWVLHFQALGMGHISLVQPLMNSQIFVVVLIGVLILKEKIVPYEWLGVGILVTGAVLLGFSATGKEGELKIMEGPLYILTGVIFVLIFSLAYATSRIKGTLWEVALAIIAGLLFSVGAIYMKATTSLIRESMQHFTLASPEVWFKVLTTPYFLGVVIAGASGFVITQGAFSHGRAAIVTPIITTVSMLVPVVAAILIFKEEITLLRGTGLLVIMIGALFLWRKGEAVT